MAGDDGFLYVRRGYASADCAGGKGKEVDDEEAQYSTDSESQWVRFLEANWSQRTRHGRLRYLRLVSGRMR